MSPTDHTETVDAAQSAVASALAANPLVCEQPHPALDRVLMLFRFLEVGITLAGFVMILAAFMLACAVYVRNVDKADAPRDRKYRFAKVMAKPMGFWFWMG